MLGSLQELVGVSLGAICTHKGAWETRMKLISIEFFSYCKVWLKLTQCLLGLAIHHINLIPKSDG